MSADEENGTYANTKTIIIRTTEAGGCGRKRQHYIRGVKDGYGVPVYPLPGHFTPTRGNILHHHIQQYINRNQDYQPEPLIPTDLIKQYDLTSDMFDAFEAEVKRGWNIFLGWTTKTDVDFTPKNLIGTEHQIIMPLSPPKHNPLGLSYAQQADIDLITKGDIVDFKFGKKSYLGKYKWQLGSYRRLARYAQLHKLCPTEEFRLINVYLGGEEAEAQIHLPKKISESMFGFDCALAETLEQDSLIRSDPKYQAPCQIDIYCAFCGWRHVCRGV